MPGSTGRLFAIPIAIALLLGTIGTVLFGFGIGTSCTTFAEDPSTCGRVDVAAWINLVGQLGLALVLVIRTRRSPGGRSRSAKEPAFGLLASLALLGACLALAESWRWM